MSWNNIEGYPGRGPCLPVNPSYTLNSKTPLKHLQLCWFSYIVLGDLSSHVISMPWHILFPLSGISCLCWFALKLLFILQVSAQGLLGWGLSDLLAKGCPIECGAMKSVLWFPHGPIQQTPATMSLVQPGNSIPNFVYKIILILSRAIHESWRLLCESSSR